MDSSIPSISVTDAAQKVHGDSVIFIDVRSPEEYREGHAAGTHNVPIQELDAAHAAELKDNSEVYVICQSGGRSSVATAVLRSMGVNAINVEGGTSAWSTSGLPIEQN